METTSLPQGSEITGNVLFYQKPEPLSRDTHGKLGLRTVDKPFGFAANTNVVPLTVTEFAPAAIAYPIIFAGEGYQPLAVMGVSQGTNLFISADGSVEPDAYLPAYIRRYPFVLAGDEKGERLIVCIDRASSLLAEGADVPMFENGEPTEYTTGCIQFCNDFEGERQRTDNFVNVLKEHDLFETVDLYEEKDLESFVTCICSLGRVVAANAPRGFTGPHIANAPLQAKAAADQARIQLDQQKETNSQSNNQAEQALKKMIEDE
jgi:hypothetical protein